MAGRHLYGRTVCEADHIVCQGHEGGGRFHRAAGLRALRAGMEQGRAGSGRRVYGLLDAHIYHGYGPFGMNRDTPAEERYKAIASYPEWTRHHIRKTTELIRSQSKHSHVKLAITEYNTMYYPNTVRKGSPNEHTLGAAVANAANLNEMIRLQRHGAYRQFLRSCEWLARRMHTGRGLLRGSVLRQGARMERASAHDIRDADL